MLKSGAALELVAQADAHGVLPAVPRNSLAGVTAEAQARYRAGRAFVLMLGSEHEALVVAAAGLPMAVIKGPVFARMLYPTPELRTFTAIDVLVAPAAVPRLATLLTARGTVTTQRDPPMSAFAAPKRISRSSIRPAASRS